MTRVLIVLSGRETSPTIASSEPPLQAGSTGPPLEEQTSTDLSAPPPPNPNPLPTSFDISVGVRLANTVRSQTGVSFSESQAAAETALKFVAQEIPQLAEVMEGLVKALEASQVCMGAVSRMSDDALKGLTCMGRWKRLNIMDWAGVCGD